MPGTNAELSTSANRDVRHDPAKTAEAFLATTSHRGHSMADRDDIIGTDSPVSAAQRATLDAVLDMIVPASEDGRLPSAVAVGVLEYIRDAAAVDPASELIATLREELDRLEEQARGRFGAAFADLAQDDRQALVDQIRSSDPRFMRQLAMQTVTCYYQDDRVLEALGMEARAPHPQGYEVVSGDLSLLDPVVQRGKRYRDA